MKSTKELHYTKKQIIKQLNEIISESMCGMTTTELVEAEILMETACFCKDTSNPELWFYLLYGYDLIMDETISAENKAFANARALCSSIRHEANWKKVLQAYQAPENSRYTLFEFSGDLNEKKIRRKNKEELGFFPERSEWYRDLLFKPMELFQVEKAKRGEPGFEYEIQTTVTGKTTRIMIPELPFTEGSECHTNKRINIANQRGVKDIILTVEEIIDAADQLDQVTKQSFRKRILSEHLFSKTEQGWKELEAFQARHQVINVVGQVGAGKSTFSDCVTVAAAKQGHRILSLCSTTTDALQKMEMFRKMGFSTACCSGLSGNVHRIEQTMDVPNFELPKVEAKQYASPCLIQNFLPNATDILLPGREPCRSFKRVEDNEKSKEKTGKKTERKKENETQEENKWVLCPYYDVCCSNLEQTKRLTAQIVTTTPQAWVNTTFGPSRTPFFLHALANFDLIIADESDMLAVLADNMFTLEFKMQAFVAASSTFHSDMYRMELWKKSRFSKNLKVFRRDYEEMAKLLEECYSMFIHQKDDLEWNFHDFSVYSILGFLRPEQGKIHRLPITMYDYLDRMVTMSYHSKNRHYRAFLEFSIKLYRDYLTDGTEFMGELVHLTREYFKEKEQITAEEQKELLELEQVEFDHILTARILFLLLLTQLTRLYRELTIMATKVVGLSNEVRSMLQTPFERFPYLFPAPAAAAYLSFSIEREEMYIKRTTTVGRAILMHLPRIFHDGERALGTNVMLMSGTSYIPGNRQFHIQDAVDILITTDEEKKEYLKTTRIVQTYSMTKISGELGNIKQEKLHQLFRSLLREDDNLAYLINQRSCGRNMLLLVNSYEQAEIVAGILRVLLPQTDPPTGIDYAVPETDRGSEIQDFFSLVYGNDSGKHRIRRKEITKVTAPIFVCPGSVIGRGYSIVDEDGNSFYDTVIFLIRPMNDPTDFSSHISKINGYLLSTYKNTLGLASEEKRSEIIRDGINQCEALFKQLRENRSLTELEEKEHLEIASCFLVNLVQVYGRLCRTGTVVKKKHPEICLMDGAFQKPMEDPENTKGRNLLDFAMDYLDQLLKDKNYDTVVAKALYAPLCDALKTML